MERLIRTQRGGEVRVWVEDDADPGADLCLTIEDDDGYSVAVWLKQAEADALVQVLMELGVRA